MYFLKYLTTFIVPNFKFLNAFIVFKYISTMYLVFKYIDVFSAHHWVLT